MRTHLQQVKHSTGVILGITKALVDLTKAQRNYIKVLEKRIGNRRPKAAGG
jgi:hypothetical protein